MGAKNKNNVDYYIKQGADGYLYEDTDMTSLLRLIKISKMVKFIFLMKLPKIY
jgi:hypothetical protein